MGCSKTTLTCVLFTVTLSLTASAQNAWWVFLPPKPQVSIQQMSEKEQINFFKQFNEDAIQRRFYANIELDERDFPVDSVALSRLLEIEGVKLRGVSRWLNAVSLEFDSAVLTIVFNHPKCRGIIPVQQYHRREIEAPSIMRSSGNYQTFFHEKYGLSFKPLAMVNALPFLERNYLGAGVKVAVLDAGFHAVDYYPAFSHLFANGQILETYDFVTNESEVYLDHIHGMFVLSVMAGFLESQLYGPAIDASFYLYRTEDAGAEYITEEDYWVFAAEKADFEGVRIINSSLGYTTFDDSLDNHQYSDLDGNTTVITIGAQTAADKGILVVNSAGNSGDNDWQYIGAPADGVDVLAIGAVDWNGERAAFSSKGPTYDGRIKPDVMALGFGAVVYNPYENTVGLANGTSFSAPLISAMAASVFGAFPQLTNNEFISLIKACSSRLANPDSLMGFGIPDFGCIYCRLANDCDEFNNALMVSPNPTNDVIRILYHAIKEQQATIQLFDVSGKVCHNEQVLIQPGENWWGFSAKALQMSKGIYIIRLIVDNEKPAVAKVVISE